VRFGIELNGVRFPYKHNPSDEEASRINVVAPGARVPDAGAYKIPIPGEFNWAGGGDPDPGRAYWCRYRDLGGQTWETRNPWRRSDNFSIRRVRHPRQVAWREQRRRNRIIERGTKTLRDLPEAMKAEARRQEAAGNESPGEEEMTAPREP
jgi:hypothetical protein